MSNADIYLVLSIIEEVKRRGGHFSEDILRDCYIEDLRKRGLEEKHEVSEKWIAYYWKRLSSRPFKDIENASSSSQQLAKLLIELLGK